MKVKFDTTFVEVSKEVIEFLLVFSRFEYALKQHGVIKDEEVAVDWDSWLNFIKEEKRENLFEQSKSHDPALLESVQYLLDNPPRTLEYTEQGVCWKKDNTSKESEARRLAILVKRVRNSLFHGEKPEVIVGGTGLGDFDRQFDLIKHSLRILYAFVDLYLDKNVFYHYTQIVECPENIE